MSENYIRYSDYNYSLTECTKGICIVMKKHITLFYII